MLRAMGRSSARNPLPWLARRGLAWTPLALAVGALLLAVERGLGPALDEEARLRGAETELRERIALAEATGAELERLLRAQADPVYLERERRMLLDPLQLERTRPERWRAPGIARSEGQ